MPWELCKGDAVFPREQHFPNCPRGIKGASPWGLIRQNPVMAISRVEEDL